MKIAKIETNIDIDTDGWSSTHGNIIVTRVAHFVGKEKITKRNVIDIRFLMSIISDGDYLKHIFETNIDEIRELLEKGET